MAGSSVPCCFGGVGVMARFCAGVLVLVIIGLAVDTADGRRCVRRRSRARACFPCPTPCYARCATVFAANCPPCPGEFVCNTSWGVLRVSDPAWSSLPQQHHHELHLDAGADREPEAADPPRRTETTPEAAGDTRLPWRSPTEPRRPEAAPVPEVVEPSVATDQEQSESNRVEPVEAVEAKPLTPRPTLADPPIERALPERDPILASPPAAADDPAEAFADSLPAVTPSATRPAESAAPPAPIQPSEDEPPVATEEKAEEILAAPVETRASERRDPFEDPEMAEPESDAGEAEDIAIDREGEAIDQENADADRYAPREQPPSAVTTPPQPKPTTLPSATDDQTAAGDAESPGGDSPDNQSPAAGDIDGEINLDDIFRDESSPTREQPAQQPEPPSKQPAEPSKDLTDELFKTSIHQQLQKPGGFAAAEFRQWTDASGLYRCRARLADVGQTSITLQLSNRRLVEVPLGRFCTDDLEFVRGQLQAQHTKLQQLRLMGQRLAVD